MKYFGKPGFWIIILVFTMFVSSGFAADTLQITSPSYFNDQSKVYEDINYLENELFSVNFCTDKEAQNIKFTAIKDSQKDLDLKFYENKNKKNCYFTNYELSYFDTSEFDFEITYSVENKDKKIVRHFVKQKQSRLINHVLSLDSEILTPVDLSYYLIVLNDVENINSDRSEAVYEKLKIDRNNNNKCWPKDRCDILKSSKILENLVVAGYPTSSRLVQDGKNYLERFKISNENNPSSFTISVDDSFVSGEEVVCSLLIDSEDEVNYEFSKSMDSIKKYASKSIGFTCNQSVEEINLRILANNGKVTDDIDFDETSSFTKTIQPYSCIGTGTTCDYAATISALVAYGGSIEGSGLLSNYIDSLIISENDGEVQYLNTGEVFRDIGKFLYYKSNPRLVEYLKFNQNNIGSWGDSSIYNLIEQTAWSILGLQKVSGGVEYIEDGKKWVYFNEPNNGWGSVEKNTLAYLAIKEQIKPYLKINAINEISEVTKFEILNPTIHNLKDVKIELSRGLNEYVSYTESLGDLSGNDKLKFDIRVNPGFYSKLSGELTVTGVDGKNTRLTLIKIPVNLVGPEPISIISGNYTVTSEVPVVALKIKKNIPDFALECTYKNPFDDTDSEISLTPNSYEIPVMNSVLKEGNFMFSIDCKFDDNSFITSGNISINVAEVTFKTIDKLEITSMDDFSFIINDTSNAAQTLTFEVDGAYKGLIEPAEESKLIAVSDSRDLFFKITNPVLLEAYGNISVGNIIIISDSGYKKKIPLTLNLGVVSESEGFDWWVWVLIIFVVLFVGLVVFRVYEMKVHGGGSGADDGSSDDDFYFD